ncbi:MAG: hypothetical protein AAB690_02025 [Patescibacteria group bacterium]
MDNKRTRPQAEEIFDILVKHAGMSPSYREQFINYWLSGDHLTWSLGSSALPGCVFQPESCTVDYSLQKQTPQKDARRDRINAELAKSREVPVSKPA